MRLPLGATPAPAAPARIFFPLVNLTEHNAHVDYWVEVTASRVAAGNDDIPPLEGFAEAVNKAREEGGSAGNIKLNLIFHAADTVLHDTRDGVVLQQPVDDFRGFSAQLAVYLAVRVAFAEVRVPGHLRVLATGGFDEHGTLVVGHAKAKVESFQMISCVEPEQDLLILPTRRMAAEDPGVHVSLPSPSPGKTAYEVDTARDAFECFMSWRPAPRPRPPSPALRATAIALLLLTLALTTARLLAPPVCASVTGSGTVTGGVLPALSGLWPWPSTAEAIGSRAVFSPQTWCVFEFRDTGSGPLGANLPPRLEGATPGQDVTALSEGLSPPPMLDLGHDLWQVELQFAEDKVGVWANEAAKALLDRGHVLSERGLCVAEGTAGHCVAPQWYLPGVREGRASSTAALGLQRVLKFDPEANLDRHWPDDGISWIHQLWTVASEAGDAPAFVVQGSVFPHPAGWFPAGPAPEDRKLSVRFVVGKDGAMHPGVCLFLATLLDPARRANLRHITWANSPRLTHSQCADGVRVVDPPRPDVLPTQPPVVIAFGH